jgi:hypothetical protein
MVSTTHSFDQHLAADANEETECNPVAEVLDEVSEREAPKPAQHGHEHLKPTKPPAWPQRIAQSQPLYAAPVRHGHGERVHRKPHRYSENSPKTNTTSTTTAASQATPETTMITAGQAQCGLQKSILARACFTSRNIDLD